MRHRRLRLAIRGRADADIDGIYDYLHDHSPASAKRFIANLQKAFSELQEMPFMGRKADFLIEENQLARFWKIKRFPDYIIIYEVHDSHIEIIRIVHGSRDLPRLFRQ